METKNLNQFIDLEGKKTVGYERSYVNVSHIIRIEKLDSTENSKIKVHLIDGTILSPHRTYASIKSDLNKEF